MRWTKKVYQRDAVRTRSGFLWIPRRINGQWRWLEEAVWKEVYELDFDYVCRWSKVKWLDLPVKETANG